MPIYAMSCGFTFIEIGKMLKKQWKRYALVLIVSSLIVLQIIHNSFTNSQGPNYPVDDIMKYAEKDGNVLILSEDPVYSSVFMVYGRIDRIPGNIIRSCIFLENELTIDFLHDWGIKYIIDQKNILNESSIKSLNLSIVVERGAGETSLVLYEVNGKINKTDCNFVCILLGKVCKNESFSEIIPLINENIYTKD